MVKRHQPALGTDAGGERLHHFRVVHVLLLRDRGHRKVVLDQELHQLAILFREAVPRGELAYVVRAELGMVAAAAFRDVVVQGGDEQQPAALEAAHQLGAERELMRQLGHREAAQVAHHHQDVLVDGVDVEQVVLHLADDAAELRQVAPEDAVLVHAPELVHDPARLLQDLQEEQLRGGVAPERRADQGAGAPQRPQRRRRHAAQLLVLHHEQERLENRRRVALEERLVDDFQQLAPHAKALVQLARSIVRGRQEARFQVLQQDRIELGDGLRRAVSCTSSGA